jgi:hypothetical protein
LEISEVDLDHGRQIAGPDHGQQHRDRWGVQAGHKPAWWVIATELGTQLDQEPGLGAEQLVTAQLPIGPDRPHHLLIDPPLQREPGQRFGLLAPWRRRRATRWQTRCSRDI